jgi:hypothetical protein
LIRWVNCSGSIFLETGKRKKAKKGRSSVGEDRTPDLSIMSAAL